MREGGREEGRDGGKEEGRDGGREGGRDERISQSKPIMLLGHVQ